MKRNLDLIRYILIFLENSLDAIDSNYDIVFPETTNEEICYNLKIMKDARLISYVDASPFEETQYCLIQMTYAGHDYLDSVRDDSIWKCVKKAGGELIKSIGFDSIKALAVKIASEKFGI